MTTFSFDEALKPSTYPGATPQLSDEMDSLQKAGQTFDIKVDDSGNKIEPKKTFSFEDAVAPKEKPPGSYDIGGDVAPGSFDSEMGIMRDQAAEPKVERARIPGSVMDGSPIAPTKPEDRAPYSPEFLKQREQDLYNKNAANLQGTMSKSTFDFETADEYDKKNIFPRAARRTSLASAQFVSGMGQFIADAYGADEAAKFFKSQNEDFNAKSTAIESGLTKRPYLERQLEGAISSSLQNVPTLAAGIFTGAEAPALLYMGLQSFGQEYSNGDQANLSFAERSARAAIYGAFEVIGEKIGMPSFMDSVKAITRGMPARDMIKSVLAHGAKEVVGEEFTTTGEFLTDKLAPFGLTPNATAQDYVQAVADTLVQTVMQTGMMAGGGAAINAGVRAQQNTPEAKADLTREWALNKWENEGFRQPQTYTQRSATEKLAGKPSPAEIADPIVNAPTLDAALDTAMATTRTPIKITDDGEVYNPDTPVVPMADQLAAVEARAAPQGEPDEHQAALNDALGTVGPDGIALHNGTPVRAVEIDSMPDAADSAAAQGRTTRQGAQAIRDLAGKAGTEVTFFADDPKLPDGFVDPNNPNRIFVSDNPQRGMVFTANHEFKHTTENITLPDGSTLNDQLVEAVHRGMTPEGRAYAYERFKSSLPANATQQEREHHFANELSADLGGWALLRKDFLSKMFTEIETRHGEGVVKSVMAKFLNGITDTIRTIKSLFKGQPSQQDLSTKVVSNLEEVHGILAKMYADKFGGVAAENLKLESERVASQTTKTTESTGPPKAAWTAEQDRVLNEKLRAANEAAKTASNETELAAAEKLANEAEDMRMEKMASMGQETELDVAAHEAATSPLNDLPQPTDAQKEAGNYKKGHIEFHGLPISIENPVGSVRSGVSANGNKWSRTMQSHYGYIKGTVGRDKDHIDTFIGRNHESQKVFVVDQKNGSGGFDEHKVMLGFDNIEAAKQGYLENYTKGWKGMGAITPTTMNDFRSWLDNGDTRQPFAKRLQYAPKADSIKISKYASDELRRKVEILSENEELMGDYSLTEQDTSAMRFAIGDGEIKTSSMNKNSILALAGEAEDLSEIAYSNASENDSDKKLLTRQAKEFKQISDRLSTITASAPTKVAAQQRTDRTEPSVPTTVSATSLEEIGYGRADNLRERLSDSKLKIPMYHGTNVEFTKFVGRTDRDGFYFSSDRDYAHGYGEAKAHFGGKPTTMKVYLSIKNPLEIDGDNDSIWKKYTQRGFDIRELKSLGYDGVIMTYGNGEVEAQVFSSDQIINDIRFSPKSYQQSAIKILEGEDAKTPMTISEVAQYFDKLHGPAADFTDPKAQERAYQQALTEFAHQIKSQHTGLDWYDGDIEQAFKITSEIIPYLAEGRQRMLFSVVAGIHSQQTKVVQNWPDAAESYQHYLRDGEFPPMNPNNGRYWATSSGVNKMRHISMVNNMIRDLGEDGFIDYMFTLHTTRELNEGRRRWGGFTEGIAGKMNDEQLGVSMFGPKVSEFIKNINGLDGVTVDKWMTRTFHRWFGNMADANGEIIDAPTEPERRVIKLIVNKIAVQYGTSPQSVQAALWYFEQGVFKKLGAGGDARGFSEAAKEFYQRETGNEYAGNRQGRSGDREAGRGSDEDLQFSPKVVFEVAPNPNDQALTDRWEALSPAQRIGISERVARTVIPDYLASIGATGEIMSQVGSYEDKTNRSFLLVVDGADPVRVAKTLGYALSQDSVIVMSDEAFEGGERRGAVTVAMGDKTADEVDAIYQKLHAANPDAIGGQSYSDGVMTILNFTDLSDNELSDEQLAKVVADGLNDLEGHYEISHHEVFTSFLEGKDYDYDNQEGNAGRNEEAVRLREGLVRERVSAAIEREFAAVKQSPKRPDDARGRVVGAGGAGPVQETKQGAVSGTGVHYSAAPRNTLVSSYFGTGYKGAELARVREATDPRIQQRIYFYVNTGRGINPESGVGPHAHHAELTNVYDATADALNLWVGRDPNEFESAVLNAGFNGYMGRASGVAVMLGQRSMPVEYLGMGERPDVSPFGEARASQYRQDLRRVQENRALPSGEMTGAEWKLLQDRVGLDLSHLDDTQRYYKNQIVPRPALQMSPKTYTHEVIDPRDNDRVMGQYQSRKAASRGADRLDQQYGAVRYVVREIPLEDSVRLNLVKDLHAKSMAIEKQINEGTSGVPTPQLKAQQTIADGKLIRAARDYAGSEEGGLKLMRELRAGIQQSPKENPYQVVRREDYPDPQNYFEPGHDFGVAYNGDFMQSFKTAKQAAAYAKDEWKTFGPQLSPKQTETPEFKRWFGDSKVVDENGKPLVVYHGTHEKFSTFDMPKESQWVGPGMNDVRDAGIAFFTSDISTARSYGEVEMPVYLSMQNPLIVDAKGASFKTFIPSAYVSDALRSGHDGVVVNNIRDNSNSGGKKATTFIVFEPTQIKSAIGNNGQFDASNPDIRYSPKPFYSALTRAVEESKTNSAPADQWVATLNKTAGVKADEIKWSGVDDWLMQKGGKVTRQEVLDYLRANEVNVQEVMLGKAQTLSWRYVDSKESSSGEPGWIVVDANDRFIDGPFENEVDAEVRADTQTDDHDSTKFSNWQLPGGENYRELLLTLPVRVQDTPLMAEVRSKLNDPAISEAVRYNLHSQLASLTSRKEAESGFRSSHFDQPNILAHVRFNERTDAEGKRVLFIEEVQSDWAQKGRKEGFAKVISPEQIKAARAAYDEAEAALEAAMSLRARYQGDVDYFKEKSRKLDLDPRTSEVDVQAVEQKLVERIKLFDDYEEKVIRLRNEAQAAQNAFERATQWKGIPNAPFVGNTSSWSMLAMKRMIRYAAENGFDKIAWTTGEQQAARYDLSKQISRITLKEGSVVANGKDWLAAYDHNGVRVIDKMINHDELADYIGKDAAEKLLAQKPKQEIDEAYMIKEIKGLDLKVGGEGMKGFYDKILPSEVNKYVKRWGVKVDEANLGNTTRLIGKDDHGGWVIFQDDGVTVRDVLSRDYARPRTFEAVAKKYFGKDYKQMQPSLTITPQMRESAMQGQPLFSPKSDDWYNKDLPRGTILEPSEQENLLEEQENAALKNSYEAWADGKKKVLKWARETIDQRIKDDSILHDQKERFIEGFAQQHMMPNEEFYPQTSPLFEDYRKYEAEAARLRAERMKMMGQRMGPPEFESMRQIADYHRAQTETENFKKWFKNSKAVDSSGRPLIGFHGTGADITEFRTVRDLPRNVANNNWLGQLGTWIAMPSEGEYDEGNAEYTAQVFSEMRGQHGGVIYPVYLSIQNPMEYEGYEELRDHRDEIGSGKKYRQWLVKNGYDGVVVRGSNTDGNQYRDDWVALHPEQIKSAIGNNGNFNPRNPNITQSPKNLNNPNSAIPEETAAQQAQRVGQDKFNRFKIVHKWLGDNGLTLSEAANVYRAEALYYGRVASRVQDFRDVRVKALIKDLEKTGHTLEEVDMALHAQHAEERNKQIAKINPQMKDGGSGMKTADARAILAKLDPELLRVANDFRAITTDTKNILLASGLIDQSMANAWDAAYKKYVPLKGGDEVVATGTGKHMDVNAKMKRAMGHSFREEHIVENIIRDHERALTLAEKNRVAQVLLQFALEADVPDLITIGQPEKRATLVSPQPVYEVRYQGGTIATLHSLQDARAEMQYHIQTTGMPAKNFAVHKVQGGPSVRYMASPMLQENEARVYLNGQMVRMQINDPLMARAYKNLGQDHLVGVLKVGREINTWLSKAYTGYNPAFLLKNIIRDAGEGVINLTGEYGAGTAARVVANYPSQFLDLLVYAKSGRASQMIRDYRADGGSTGAAYLGDLERIGEDARAAYNDYAGVLDTARRDGVTSALGVAGDKTVSALAHYIEVLNQAGENAMRLSTYKTLREAGYSRSEAALAAKDVTINFNRKGEIGQQAGALWLFFNPAVQGSARTLHTLLHSEHKAQAWALTGAMALLFYAMAAWNNDVDKKRWEETPDYDKAHNLIIPMGKYQVKIPISYGYGFFGALGTAAFDLQHGKPMKNVVWQLANAFAESFSPIGNPVGDKPDYKNMSDIVPFTPLKVATQIGVNRSGLGGPIYPENQRAGKPDSATMFRNTKGSIWDWAAAAANKATGGNEAQAGWVDVHPDTIKSLWATATGGTGRFITDSAQLANVVARGASPELHEMPIARDFLREPRIGDTRKAFWDAANQVEVAQGEFATAKANMQQANKGTSPEARADAAKIKDQVLADTQALRALGSTLTQFKKAVDAKRDAIDAIQADKSLTLNEQRLKVREMEVEEKALYDRFLAIFRNQQARSQKR